jgi:transcription elongation GreA/GreB family factor
MSKAFTNEDDSEAIADIGERPVSTHRNLVTAHGLRQIEKHIADLTEELGKAEIRADRERLATASRDLRYWTARRENAELTEPEGDTDVVRFGMRVTIVNDKDVRHAWLIVGEDEADPAKGTISHASPMAQALFGKGVGDTITVAGNDWEILEITIPKG